MKSLTQSKFSDLSDLQKTEVFFDHDDNMVQGKNRSRGPSVRAQAEWWNNWLSALGEFQNKLPVR